MISTLVSAGVVGWISICVKTLAYSATLLAVGSVLVHMTLQTLDDGVRRYLRHIAVGGAIVAAAASALRIPVRASFLTGGTIEGATDPMLLTMVTQGPLGFSVIVRLVGLALLLVVFINHRIARMIAALGGVIVAASFAFRGHALGDPHLVLGTLVTVHILGLAFWVGAFAPLHRAARPANFDSAGQMAHEFGQKALWVVGALFVAGAVTLLILTGGRFSAVFSLYGQFFLLKLMVFGAVMGLAALNKLFLTPALARGDAEAAAGLRRSIKIEAALVGLILLTTAALTTTSSPPPKPETAAVIHDPGGAELPVMGRVPRTG